MQLLCVMNATLSKSLPDTLNWH